MDGLLSATQVRSQQAQRAAAITVQEQGSPPMRGWTPQEPVGQPAEPPPPGEPTAQEAVALADAMAQHDKLMDAAREALEQAVGDGSSEASVSIVVPTVGWQETALTAGMTMTKHELEAKGYFVETVITRNVRWGQPDEDPDGPFGMRPETRGTLVLRWRR